MKVVEENDKIVIQPASAEVIYVPQYQPEMLYEEDYIYRPSRTIRILIRTITARLLPSLRAW